MAREIRRRAGLVVGPTLIAAVIGYFLLNAVQGERGLLAWMQLSQRIAAAEVELAGLRAERARLEALTGSLYSDRLDRDLLDERVRRMTGLGRADEIQVPLLPGEPIH